MRLWSFRPKYLDPKGLVAVWREGLLALSVLQEKTRGYRNHPQLMRFKSTGHPVCAINIYLRAIFDDSQRRGYHFDREKLLENRIDLEIPVTEGQMSYEWRLFKQKIKFRNQKHYSIIESIGFPEAHPLFKIISGRIEPWEKIKESIE